MTLDSTVRTRLGRAMAAVREDYDRWRPPFRDRAGVTTPVTRRLDGDRERALFLTLTTALNRQRDAEQLYAKFGRLWYEEPWLFEPETLVGEERYDDLLALFEAEDVRFGEQDARAWYEISRTLYFYYDGDPMRLFAAHDYERPSVERQVVEAAGDALFFRHNFPMLRGEKTRPTWLRLIHDQVHPLGGAGGTDVPIGTRVAEFTGRLLGEPLTTDDEERVRRFWRRVCEDRPVRPVDVDGPAWCLERDWEEWGREYAERRLREAGLELHPERGLEMRRQERA